MMADMEKIKKLAQVDAKKMRGDKDYNPEGTISDNNLTYKFRGENSVVAARNKRNFYFHKNVYGENDNMVLDLQTGQGYVNWGESHLYFCVKVTTNDASDWSLDTGSACNFIRDVIVTSRSGVEVDRINDLNHYRIIKDHLSENVEFFSNKGKNMGYNVGTQSSGAEVCFSIPMNKVAPVFDTKGILMPAYLCSGLRLEIQTDSVANAISSATATSATLEITKPYIKCDVHLLSETAQRKMTDVASSNGLEFSWHAWHRSQFNSTNNSLFAEIRKTTSKALCAMATSRTDSVLNNISAPSLACDVFDTKTSQWRLGSQYFPQNKLETDAEHYDNVLYSLARPDKHNYQKDRFENDIGVVAALLERSHIISDAYLPINNSRSLGLDVTFDSAVSRQVNVYLKYLKLAKIFISNTVILE